MKYCALLKYNLSARLVAIVVPDLNLHISNSQFNNLPQLSEKKIKKLLVDTIEKELKKLESENRVVKVPKDLNFFSFLKINSFDRWIIVEVNYKLKKKFFEKGFPLGGQLGNIGTIIGNAAVTLLALILAIGEENNSTSLGLGLSGTILTSIVSLSLYLYSGADQTLGFLGRKIDDKSREDEISQESNPLMAPYYSQSNTSSTTKKISVGLGISAVIISNLIVTSITVYQETIGLCERYNNKKGETISEEASHFLALSFMISLILGTLGFQASFAYKAYESLLHKKEVEHSDSISEEEDIALTEEKSMSVEEVDYSVSDNLLLNTSHSSFSTFPK